LSSNISNISRRDFLKSSLITGLAAPLLVSCGLSTTEPESTEPRLTARPGTPTPTPTKGLTQLGLISGRDGILYVPESYSPDTPTPLFIGMHGAGGGSSDWMSYHARAEERGMIFMAPDSRGSTWDLIRGGYGADLEFLDKALKYVFNRCNIDSTRLAFGGFSDGASYALSLGISNGDLFSHLIGYSPGSVERTDPLVGKPQIYVSHGTHDSIIPVRASRDFIVPALLDDDYDVTYNEFEGGHEVPAAVSEGALDWFLGVEEDGPRQQ
jgi:phospholipase/carboxylesterase